MKHSPLPWSQERRNTNDPHEVMLDANGKSIFDTINSDVALMETEIDEDEVTSWDEQGRADFEFILKAIEYHNSYLTHLNLSDEAKADSIEAILELTKGVEPNDAIIALASRVVKAEGDRDRLEKTIESAEAAIEGVDLREGHIRDNSTPDELRQKLLGAGIRIAKQDASFDLRWNADMRAIKQWRDAHPGNELVQPDHADMVVWLLEELDRARGSGTRDRRPSSQSVP